MTNVNRMLRSLTFKEFAELLEYKRLEPFRELRADYRTASVVQMLANIHRGKGQKPYELEDMRLKFGEPEPKKRQTPEEQLKILTLFSAIHNMAPNAVVKE